MWSQAKCVCVFVWVHVYIWILSKRRKNFDCLCCCCFETLIKTTKWCTCWIVSNRLWFFHPPWFSESEIRMLHCLTHFHIAKHFTDTLPFHTSESDAQTKYIDEKCYYLLIYIHRTLTHVSNSANVDLLNTFGYSSLYLSIWFPSEKIPYVYRIPIYWCFCLWGKECCVCVSSFSYPYGASTLQPNDNFIGRFCVEQPFNRFFDSLDFHALITIHTHSLSLPSSKAKTDHVNQTLWKWCVCSVPVRGVCFIR